MALDLIRLRDLREGTIVHADVGELAAEACQYLQSYTKLVRLHFMALHKIERKRHGATDSDFMTMDFGLRHGLMATDQKNPKEIVISYVLPDSATRWKIGVRSCADGLELWITTFHRMRKRQTRSLLKRGVIIKRHS